MQHCVAYYESADQAATLQPIAAVPDSILYVVGDQVRIPAELPFLAGGMCLTTATSFTQAQIRTPTLRELFYPSFFPRSNQVNLQGQFANLPISTGNPMALTGLEQMEFWTDTDHAAAIPIYGVAFLQDGPQQPVTGEILTIRATGAATLSAGQWVNTQLTFDQVLPVGNYQVVGMVAQGANLTAARLVFQGYSWRPGVIGVSAAVNGDGNIFRFGNAGVLGTFNNNVPPTVDCLGSTDTSQAFYLDLIKVG
jgi:hypothetical protein